MPKPPKAFDVWFVAANTVYKGVPYTVVADWAQQGRLAPADKVRPAGTNVAWAAAESHDYLADYLPRPVEAVAVPAEPVAAAASPGGFEVVTDEHEPVAAPAPAGEHAELPDPEPPPRAVARDEDDDVDMIPLIDISMVLLVFFIMMRAAGALAPVDVPEMKYAGQLSNDPDAVTITIEKKTQEEVFYAVRVGQQPPKPGHDQLTTPEAAITALNDLLATAQRPPEVRIACRKELPRERVYELRRELEPLQKKNLINSFTATVIEAPKKD
jgi:biopolymer transport protein ExbD